MNKVEEGESVRGKGPALQGKGDKLLIQSSAILSPREEQAVDPNAAP